MGRDFPPVQTGPGAHPASYTMGTGSFLRVKCGRGVLLTTHSLLVPRSWKSRAIPLPTLWATTGPVTGTLYLYLYCAGGKGDSRNLSFGLRFKPRTSTIQIKRLRQLSGPCNLHVHIYEVYILLNRQCLKKIVS